MDTKIKFTRKIQTESIRPEKTEQEKQRALERKMYTIDLQKVAMALRSMVVTLDTFSMSLVQQAETLEKNRCSAVQLVQCANQLQEIGSLLQNESTAIEKKSKFPPQ